MSQQKQKIKSRILSAGASPDIFWPYAQSQANTNLKVDKHSYTYDYSNSQKNICYFGLILFFTY